MKLFFASLQSAPLKARIIHAGNSCLATVRRDKLATAILAAAAVTYVGMLLRFPHLWHTHDFGGHEEYINYILKHFMPPPGHGGWEFFQPPLYYYCVALVVGLWRFIAGGDGFMAGQFFSLLCYGGFLAYSVKTIKRAVMRPFLFHLTLAGLAFWPIGALIASRINNDILFYLFYAGAFYHLTVWHETLSGRALAKAIVFAGLSVAAKSNGLFIGAVIGVMVFYRWHRGDIGLRQLLARPIIIAACVAGLLALSNFGRIAYSAYTGSGELSFIPNQPGLNPNLILSADWYYLFSFDSELLLRYPFFAAQQDVTGRQYFWVSLLKTSLFGEYEWRLPQLAILMNFTLLCMSVYAGVSLLCMRGNDPLITRRAVLYGAALFVPVTALMYMARIGDMPVSYGCSQDFRYIYPIVTPFLIAYVMMAEHHRSNERHALYYTGIALLLLLIWFSVIFLAAQIALPPK